MNTNDNGCGVAAEMLTPPQLAKRWGVAADKILSLIHSGQLTGINLAVKPRGRPRFRIRLEEVRRFEEARASKPPVPKQRRRRRSTATPQRDYF